MKPHVVDLFAGVGGLSLGFSSVGFKVVLAVEYDPSIAASFSKNHPGTTVLTDDITSLDLDRVFSPLNGTVEVVVGGPPCQGFSQKGERRSIDDERNFLFQYFYEVVRIVDPRYFVLENVPTLLTTSNQFFYDQIREVFTSLGYQLDAGTVDASDFGVPQNRKRAVILGKKHGSISLPVGRTHKVTVSDAISDLAFLESGEGAEVQEYPYPPLTEYQSMMRCKAGRLFNHVVTNHSETALERLSMIPEGGGKESLPPEHHTKSIYSGTWCRMLADSQSVTITTRFDTPSSGRFVHPTIDRAITVREAARLQSFPDDFIFYGTKSSQMKQVGNAVPPLLGRAIAQVIKDDIETSSSIGKVSSSS